MVNVTASYSPKHFLLKIRSIYIIIRPVPCWQQDSLLLTGPGIYPQTFHRNPCPAVLFFKVVGLFQISQKEWLFYLLWQQGALGVDLTMWPCKKGCCTLQKRLSSPPQVGQEENISGHSVERRAYWFVLKITWVLPIPTGREGIVWWTLL